MVSYCLKSLIACTWIALIACICDWVAATGCTGLGPGFTGGIKGTAHNVMNTAGVTVRYRRSRRPLPRWETTDAALVLTF